MIGRTLAHYRITAAIGAGELVRCLPRRLPGGESLMTGWDRELRKALSTR
jgi:hypothetical protein